LDGSLKLGCENNEHVLKWTLTRLKLKNSLEVRQMMYDFDEEIEVGTSGEWIVKYLVPIDNAAIPSDILIHFGLCLWKRVHNLLNQTFKMDGGISGSKVIMSYRAIGMVCYKVAIEHTS
jgi:hypothetical protein